MTDVKPDCAAITSGWRRALNSRSAHFFFGILVSAALLLYVMSLVEWQRVAEHLGEVRYWAIIPSVLIWALHMGIRAYRWRYLLPPAPERIPFRRLFDAFMIGVFATFILPFRAGEFVRPFYLKRYSQYSFLTCFVSVVVERFFDLATVLLGFSLMVVYVPDLPRWASVGARGLAVLAGIIFVLLAASAFMPAYLSRLYDALSRPLPGKIVLLGRRFLDDLLQGARVLKSPLNLLRVIGLSLAVWFSSFLCFYVFFLFFRVEPSALVALSVTVIVALAVAAPSAPGFLGPYEVGCVAAFVLFGLGENLGTAYAIITHLFQYVVFVLYGLYVLNRDALRLGELKKAGSPEEISKN